MLLPAVAGPIVVAGLLTVGSYQAPVHANAQLVEPRPETPQTVSSQQQWATFDFVGPNASGRLQPGQPLELSIAIGGIPPDPMPMVAICESAHFESQIITLKPDPSSPVMNATTTLVPVSQDRFSLGPQISRLHVTFARSTDKKFERVMTRIVYLTMGETKPARDEPASLTTHQDPPKDAPGEIDLAARQAEPVPGAIPLVNEEVVEEDLLPPRSVQPTPVYWQQVRDLLHRSWNRATLRMPSSAHQTVHMQFRLYPGGRAQFMQMVDGSGLSEIDQAAIHAIAVAQPFPPFPMGVGNDPFDIHVHLQTGSKTGVRDFRTVVRPQKPNRTFSSMKK